MEDLEGEGGEEEGEGAEMGLIKSKSSDRNSGKGTDGEDKEGQAGQKSDPNCV
jgi:hypothetical protein